jgi:hypothetical protein
MFELWSSEISGPGTSAYYRTTLIRAMTESKPLTYDEHKAAEAAFRGTPLNSDWMDSAQEIYACLSAAVAKRNAIDIMPTNMWDREQVYRQLVTSPFRPRTHSSTLIRKNSVRQTSDFSDVLKLMLFHPSWAHGFPDGKPGREERYRRLSTSIMS